MKVLLYVLLLLPLQCYCFIPIISVTGISTWFSNIQRSCWFGVCCKNFWDKEDFNQMRNELKRKLYGQHIAEEMVVNHLISHFTNPDPKKALVLSLHGTTGSGKNYLTGIVMKHLLYKGMKDPHLRLWNAKHHFSNSKELEAHQEDLKREIQERTRVCPRSVFVFDEANELPPHLLDVLKPMMDEYHELDGVDYRQTTFFFLSNTGSTKINEIMMQFKQNKEDRKTMKLRHFQPLIQDGSFNEKGGFLKSKLIEKNLIDSYVPFLPLEKEHIKQCIKYYLDVRQCKIDETKVESIAELVHYEPPREKYFSPYGCRGVDNLIKQEMEDECIFRSPKDEL